MSQAVDYYKVLHLPFGAKKDDIISAYRRLSKLYHPDINAAPGAEETMKQINAAYHTLHDDTRRAEYHDRYMGRAAAVPADDTRALETIHAYFSALMNGAHEKAYALLCRHDRQYVTLASFTKWRQSVLKIYAVRDFSVRPGAPMAAMTLENGETVRARQFVVHVTEKNHVTGQVDTKPVNKLAILDQGVWRTFLGYRDLNDIACVFEQLFAEQQQSEMLRHWEAYCSETCRELDILSLNGLLKQAERELYRFKRYNQPLVVACYSIANSTRHMKPEQRGAMLEKMSRALTDELRETDIPAYIGDGVFAVLFTGLKKRQAGDITARLAENLREALQLDVAGAYESYTGGTLQPYLDGLCKGL